MKYSFLIFFTFLNSLCFACLNEDHVTKSGKVNAEPFSLRDLAFYKKQNIAVIEQTLNRLLADNPATEDEKRADKNDIAVNYIKLGRLDEAEKILLELIKQYPENYSINVNLGTLYELKGKNKEALQLIRKSVAINPDSHDGSEWFHIKILEYKLKNIPDQKIADQNILDLYHVKKSANEIAEQLSYQLKERIPFTPAPDMLLAKVMQEFGDYLADSVSIKAAYLMYGVGMDYDRKDILKFGKKRDDLIPYFKKYKEDVPVTDNYYLDPLINTVKDNPIQVVSNVFETGMNYFEEQEKIKREKESQKRMLIAGIIVVASLSVLFLYFKNRKKKRLAE